MNLLCFLLSLQGVSSFQSTRAVHSRPCSSCFQSSPAVEIGRRNTTFGLNFQFPNVFSRNSYADQQKVAAEPKRGKSSRLDSELVFAELREKDLKELKLECSRRQIRYVGFEDKEDFVQAIYSDIKQLETYSLSGTILPGRVADVSGDILREELDSDIPLLLDVYATFCGPCKLVVPEFEATALKLGKSCRVAKIDSGKYPFTASKFQVQALPTTLLIHRGKVVDRIEGTVSRQHLMQFVKPYVEEQ